MAGAIDTIKGLFGRLAGKPAAPPQAAPFVPSPTADHASPAPADYREATPLQRVAKSAAPVAVPQRESNGMQAPVSVFFGRAAWDGNVVEIAPPSIALRIADPEASVSFVDRPRGSGNRAAISVFFAAVDWSGNGAADQSVESTPANARYSSAQFGAEAVAAGPQDFDAKSVFGDFDFN